MAQGARCTDATLIILAGGVSERMGRPKSTLPACGGTLIEQIWRTLGPGFRETLCVGGGRGVLPQARAVPDVRGPRSPLLGIYSGLLSCRTELAFVVACDVPFVRRELVERVLTAACGADAAVPRAHGHYEPLCAAYRRTTLPLISQALKRDELKITSLYKRLNVRLVPEPGVRAVDPELRSFVNLNTPQDLAQLSVAGADCGGGGRPQVQSRASCSSRVRL